MVSNLVHLFYHYILKTFYLLYFKANLLYFKANLWYFKANLLYFNANLLYFKANLLYFKANLLYFKANLLYFKANLLYFKANLLYFKANLLYFSYYILKLTYCIFLIILLSFFLPNSFWHVLPSFLLLFVSLFFASLKLLNQKFLQNKMFTIDIMALVNRYGLCVLDMPTDMFRLL